MTLEQLLTETRWLTALSRALLGDEHDAEDVAQQTRLAALEHAPEDPAHARAWLVRVARNFARRLRRQRVRTERRERLAAIPEALPSSDELVSQAQMQRRVVDAVLELSEPQRSTVLLRYFHALSAREIAARQGLPVETVRTRIKRALAQLRGTLDREFGGRGAWALVLGPGLIGSGFLTTASVGSGAGSLSGSAVASGPAAAVLSGVTTMSLVGKWSAAALVTVAAAVAAWKLVDRDVVSSHANEPSAAVARAPVATSTAPEPSTAERESSDVAPARERVEPTPLNAPADASTYTITALVLESGTQRPIADAALTLRYTEAGTYASRVATGRTDADGRARVVASSVAPWYAYAEVVSHDHAPWVNESVAFNKAVDRTLDLGTILLVRGAAVSGRVVRARDGTAVGGAELWLLRQPPGQSWFAIAQARHVGSSRADGSFELSERAASPFDRPLTLFAVVERSDASLAAVGWTSFDVVRHREMLDGIDVKIGPAAPLHVRVVDEAGAPVAGADVQAEPRFAPLGPPSRAESHHAPSFGADPRIVASFQQASDARGEAAFPSLPVGSADPSLDGIESGPFDAYDVIARMDGFDVASVDRVRVTPRHLVECELVLKRTRRWSIAGCVTDEAGAPIRGASVRELTRAVTVSTDADGNYRVDGIDSSRDGIALDVRAPGCREWQDWLPAAKLSKGEDSTWRVDVTLERQARIAGRVVDESGAPVVGANVWLEPVKPRPRADGASFSYRPDPPETDAAGRFAFGDASEAEWQIVVFPPSADGEWHEPTVVRAHGGDEDVRIVVHPVALPRSRLLVELVDAATGELLDPSDASVQPLFEAEHFTPIRIDRTHGRLECWPLLPGRWQLYVKLTNRWRVAREFEVANADDVVNLRLECGPPGRIEVGVDGIDAEDRGGARDVPLELQWASCAGVVRHKLGTERTFTIDDAVPDEPVRISVVAGSLYDELFITPKSGETTRVTLHATSVAWLSVKVADPSAVGRVDLSISSNDGPSQWRTVLIGSSAGARGGADASGASNAARLEPVKPGRVRWRATFVPAASPAAAFAANAPPTKQWTGDGELEIAAGETRTIELRGR